MPSSSLPPPPLWSQPLASRPRPALSPLPLLRTLLWTTLFNLGILSTFFLLLFLLPLRLVRRTRPLYVSIGKGAFGCLVVGLTPEMEFVVSAGEGVEGTEWVEVDARGEVERLRLPDQGVWIANHSTLVDWFLLWSFSYLSGHHNSIYIVLKASIRQIPIIGQCCSLFNFIFLSRKWESDRDNFTHQLSRISRTTLDGGEGEKAAVLIFPEGTIVTENTRRISGEFAAKAGVQDFSHLLLPRSTGLLHTLRTLSLTLPSLTLLDLTIGYPVPRLAPSSSSPSSVPPHPPFPSEFYSLPSVLLPFFAAPPPQLHIHLRAFKLSAIPIGDHKGIAAGQEATEEEKSDFEGWLKGVWGEKEGLVEGFRREGSFVPSSSSSSPLSKKEEQEDGDGLNKGEYRYRPHLRRPLLESLYAFSAVILVGSLLSWGMWRYGGTVSAAVGGAWRALSGGGGGAAGGGTAVEETVEVLKGCGCKGMKKAAEEAARRATMKGLGEL